MPSRKPVFLLHLAIDWVSHVLCGRPGGHDIDSLYDNVARRQTAEGVGMEDIEWAVGACRLDSMYRDVAHGTFISL